MQNQQPKKTAEVKPAKPAVTSKPAAAPKPAAPAQQQKPCCGQTRKA